MKTRRRGRRRCVYRLYASILWCMSSERVGCVCVCEWWRSYIYLFSIEFLKQFVSQIATIDVNTHSVIFCSKFFALFAHTAQHKIINWISRGTKFDKKKLWKMVSEFDWPILGIFETNCRGIPSRHRIAIGIFIIFTRTRWSSKLSHFRFANFFFSSAQLSFSDLVSVLYNDVRRGRKRKRYLLVFFCFSKK